MANERRYRDDEVAAIFEAAATNIGAGAPGTGENDGLTLPELKAIGREVGIAPERIERAAATLERRGVPSRRGTFLGIPVSVGRSASLTRPLTDREWGALVTEIRETFVARGTERSTGGVRHWANGNLNVFVEPYETGTRIRIGTRKGDAGLFNAFGITAALIGIGNLTGLLTTTGGGAEFPGASMIAIGVAIIGGNAFRLTRWSRVREDQMAHVIERSIELLEATPDSADPGAGD